MDSPGPVFMWLVWAVLASMFLTGVAFFVVLVKASSTGWSQADRDAWGRLLRSPIQLLKLLRHPRLLLTPVNIFVALGVLGVAVGMYLRIA